MRENTSPENEFERLLRLKNASFKNAVNSLEKEPEPVRTRADANASVDDFIVMLARIVSKVMKKQKVEFKPDEGARLKVDQSEDIDHPYITFRIIECDKTQEIKPRIRESGYLESSGKTGDYTRRQGDIFGQLFHLIVQFDIFADSYTTANEVMNAFEDLIFSYTAYFKRNGVKDVRFERRFTDTNLDQYRQKCSARSLQYSVDIEKLFTRFTETIEEINVR